MAIETPLKTAGASSRGRHLPSAGGGRRPLRRRPGRIWVKCVVGLLLVVEVYPLVWMFLTSL
ncbi:hypothetical protein ACFYYU_50415, partial [Streptomyces olivochromogenes]